MSQHLSFFISRKAFRSMPGSERYSGNPTVADRRGACGNVDHGGTRHPPRLSKERVLETLRLQSCAPQIYPDGSSRQGCTSYEVKVLCRQLPDSDGKHIRGVGR